MVQLIKNKRTCLTVPNGLTMALLQSAFIILAIFGFNASAQKTYSCDFESGICSFLSNDRNNRENWKIGRGKLNSEDTGPAIDHTFGNANGSYLFVNGTAAKTWDVKLQSVILTTNYCVGFFYHMYGADIGSLSVKTQNLYLVSDIKEYFVHRGTQGDRWKEAIFSVVMTNTMKYRGYRVVFVAQHNSSSSFIAIDDVEMKPGICPDEKKEAEKLCNFDDYDCGYAMSKRSGALKWEWKAVSMKPSNYTPSPPTDHTLGTSDGGYWLAGTKSTISTDTAVLTSPSYDKPKQSLNCLHFYYYMDADKSESTWWWSPKEVKEAYLQAWVKHSANDKTLLITKAKNITNHRTWHYAEAKVELTKNYQIEFVTAINAEVEVVIALDDVQLFPGTCLEAEGNDTDIVKRNVTSRFAYAKVRKCTARSVTFYIATSGPVKYIESNYREGKQASNATTIRLTPASGNIYEIGNLLPSGIYSFQFRTMPSESDDWSRQYNITLLPDAPEIIWLSIGNGNVRLQWFTKTDDVLRGTIDRYQIKYFSVQMVGGNSWTTSNCPVTIEVPTCVGSSYTIWGLEQTVFYQIEVRAHTEAGYGELTSQKVYLP